MRLAWLYVGCVKRSSRNTQDASRVEPDSHCERCCLFRSAGDALLETTRNGDAAQDASNVTCVQGFLLPRTERNAAQVVSRENTGRDTTTHSA